jgi:hypothetical protein
LSDSIGETGERGTVSSSEYTTMAVADLPYPSGLGKGDYEDLEREMRLLLGSDYARPAANERLFWTPEYQGLITAHLAPKFARSVEIVEVAQAAAEVARSSDVFGRAIPGGSTDTFGLYTAKLPARVDYPSTRFEQEVQAWTRHPPRLFDDGTSLEIDDGRHRLSLLRSKIQHDNPGFGVLVHIRRS